MNSHIVDSDWEVLPNHVVKYASYNHRIVKENIRDSDFTSGTKTQLIRKKTTKTKTSMGPKLALFKL